MKFTDRPLVFFLIITAVISFFYLRGVSEVPFHPDESTQLFTSADVDLFWQRPSALYWQPDQEDDPRQRYRELDAPLTRNLIALGRWTAGLPSLPVDWNWGLGWEENKQAGALPSADQLMAGRMACAVLFPFSLLFLFLAVRRATGTFAAFAAALLLAINALALLHTRRAMAESALLFTTTLSLWSMVKAEKRPWLTGIPLALAFCAKQTLAALAPVSLLAVLWTQASEGIPNQKRRARAAAGVLAFGALMLVVTALFSPFAWQRPVPAVQAALRARSALASAQVSDRPEQALDTPSKKLIALLGSLYLTPPIFAETINYTQYTAAAEAQYLANPLHALLRSLPAGGILLAASIFGYLIAARHFFTARQNVAEQARRRRLGLLLLATLVQFLALLAVIPLPWQRYYLPLVPFGCIWTAYALNELIRLGSLRRGSAGPAHPEVRHPGT